MKSCALGSYELGLHFAGKLVLSYNDKFHAVGQGGAGRARASVVMVFAYGVLLGADFSC